MCVCVYITSTKLQEVNVFKYVTTEVLLMNNDKRDEFGITHTHTYMLIDLWRKISACRDAVIHDDMMIQNMHACLHNDASSTCGICNFLCMCVCVHRHEN